MEIEIDSSLISQQRKDLLFQLSRKAWALGAKSIEAVPVLMEGDPKKVLPRLADEHAPSMIVLGTHGGGWADRSLLGSVAEGILRSTQWPSLTVGPQVSSLAAKLAPFERILYATDFSPAAAHAASFAVAFAEAFHSRLDILSVAREDELLHHSGRLNELRAHFYATLNRTVPDKPRDFRTFVAAGKARDEILKHIDEHSIDLLVLGMPRTSHLHIEIRIPGVFPLILEAPCPVLTVVAASERA